MLEILVELADAWTETDYNLGATCAAGGNEAFIWHEVLCPMGDALEMGGFLGLFVFMPLYFLGMLAIPVVAIAEFFRRGRPFPSFRRDRTFLFSLRAAVISAVYSLLFFIPYILNKSKDSQHFKCIRAAGYISVYLFWLASGTDAWIHSLANRSAKIFSTTLNQVNYPQRPNEEIITAMATVVMLLTCAYSALYLWRAHRAGMISSFSIAPFVLAVAWVMHSGNTFECAESSWRCGAMPANELEFRGTSQIDYYWAVPLMLASLAWIAYTSIKLWRSRPGANPPAASGPGTGTPPSSGSSTSDPPTVCLHNTLNGRLPIVFARDAPLPRPSGFRLSPE